MKNKTPYIIRKVRGKGSVNHLKDYLGYYCLVIPLKIKDFKEARNLQMACKNRTEFCNFGFMGKSCKIYTDGLTEHIKPMIPLIKDKILTDCIANPKKYLDDCPTDLNKVEGKEE